VSCFPKVVFLNYSHHFLLFSEAEERKLTTFSRRPHDPRRIQTGPEGPIHRNDHHVRGDYWTPRHDKRSRLDPRSGVPLEVQREERRKAKKERDQWDKRQMALGTGLERDTAVVRRRKRRMEAAINKRN